MRSIIAPLWVKLIRNIIMPIYTYRCENCGIQFERRQKFEDDPLTVCPDCEESSLRKIFQPVGILFKGSGFYSTDNRSSSGSNRQATKNDTDSGEKTKDNQKKDSESKSSKSKETKN